MYRAFSPRAPPRPPLGDVDPDFLKFAMDSGGAPKGIGLGHSCDEGADLGVDGRAASGPGGERGPVEALPLSPHDGVGSHDDDDEGLPPADPHPGERDPGEPIAAAQVRTVHRPLIVVSKRPQLDRVVIVFSRLSLPSGPARISER